MSYEDYWGGKIVGTLLLEDVWDNTIECLSSTQDITVFDRYYIDFLVYSPILGSDISFQQPILDAFPKASLNFYLDELPQVCYERIWNRRREKNLYVCKREDLSVLSQARDAFLKIAKSIPEYYIIQSTGKTADLISKEIWNITTQYLR